MRTLYFALAILQAAAIWRWRAFPTQDGPVQLYYADVFADLLRGGNTYGEYFRTQSHSPVYAFLSYALVALNGWFAPLTSERVLVSAYVLVFAAGAWLLVRSVNGENDWLPFFVLPFAFHLYLFLGIYNYTFGLAGLLFAMAVWLRGSRGWGLRSGCVWLALVALLCTLHPLVVAFLGLFVAAHLCARWMERKDWRALWPGIAMAAPVPAALLWLATYRSRGIAAPMVTQPAAADRLRLLVQMIPFSPYFEPVYRFALLLLALLPLGLLAMRARRGGWKPRGGAAGSWALAALASAGLATFLFGPPWAFGAGFFADRMAVLFLLCGLPALAPLMLPAPLRRAVVGIAVCAALLLMGIRDRRTGEIVSRVAPLYDAAPRQQGGWGALVSGTEAADGLYFNPYYWAAAHYVRASHAVLLNTPWIHGSLAVITPRERHAWDGMSPDAMGSAVRPSRLDFVCGGKPARAETGMIRVFESELHYCDAAVNEATRSAMR